jgi:hypothetical protein
MAAVTSDEPNVRGCLWAKADGVVGKTVGSEALRRPVTGRSRVLLSLMTRGPERKPRWHGFSG